MAKKIELDVYGEPGEEELLHADADDHLVKIAQSAFDHIESEFKRLNPDKQEEWRLMCGGCWKTIMHNLHDLFFEAADASEKDTLRFLSYAADRANPRMRRFRLAASDRRVA